MRNRVTDDKNYKHITADRLRQSFQWEWYWLFRVYKDSTVIFIFIFAFQIAFNLTQVLYTSTVQLTQNRLFQIKNYKVAVMNELITRYLHNLFLYAESAVPILQLLNRHPLCQESNPLKQQGGLGFRIRWGVLEIQPYWLTISLFNIVLAAAVCSMKSWLAIFKPKSQGF